MKELQVYFGLSAVTGMIYLLFVREELNVDGHTTATADKIMASVLLFRQGEVSDLLSHIFSLFTSLFFFNCSGIN